MKIDIVTVTFNCKDYIKNFLEGIYGTTGVDFNLYIFDNASSDGSKKILREYELLKSNIKIVYSDKNINYGPANNYLVKNFCREKLLLFLNNDILFTENWLDNLINGMTDSEADIVGAKLVYPQNKIIQHCGIKFDICGMPQHIYKFAPADIPEVNQRKEFPNVTAACMLMKREDFLNADGFDEKYINGYEDNDLCMKLFVEKKKIVYEPKCELLHFESVSPGIRDFNKFSGEYFFKKWSYITLKLGKEALQNIPENSFVNIFGAGEKCRQLLKVLELYKIKINNIYDRKKKKIEFWNNEVRDINDLINDNPKNLIIASIHQYPIITELKTIVKEVNLIPVCSFI